MDPAHAQHINVPIRRLLARTGVFFQLPAEQHRGDSSDPTLRGWPDGRTTVVLMDRDSAPGPADHRGRRLERREPPAGGAMLASMLWLRQRSRGIRGRIAAWRRTASPLRRFTVVERIGG
jgi:hypothetical protein